MNQRGWQLSGISWWLAAWLLLLSRWLPEPVADVTVIEPPYTALIAAESAWDVPLNRLPGMAELARWPVWLAAAAAACVIACYGNRLACGGGGPAAVVAVLSAGLSVAPSQWVSLLVTGMATTHSIRFAETTRCWQWVARAVLILLAGCLSTIDFGLAVLLLIAAPTTGLVQAMFSSDRQGMRKSGAVCLVLVGVSAAAAVLQPAFAAALLRPVSAVWLGLDSDLVPWLASPVWSPQLWPTTLGAIVLTALLLRRWPYTTSLRIGIQSLVICLCLVTTGFGSRYWLGPAVTGIAATLSFRSTRRPARASGQRSRIPAAVAISCACLLLLWPLRKADLVSPALGLSQRVVSPQQLYSGGTVLLTDPWQSDDWAGTPGTVELRLVANNRWDPAPAEWLDYLAVCRDVRNGRHERYRRVDGGWGGYRPHFDTWDPLLVVLNSEDEKGIRQLSLDPAWQTLMVDSRKTVFGNAASGRIGAQARQAADLLFYLEWPDPAASVNPEGTLEIGTAADARRVAGVMNAMRLPYAALTVLPLDDHLETRVLRAWAFTELAVRAIRQTGQTSLIDHSRAMILLKSLQGDLRLSVLQRERIDSNLRSLLGHRISSSAMTDLADDAMPHDEEQIREFLTAGRTTAAAAVVAKLAPSAVRDYYEAIMLIAADLSDQALEQLAGCLLDESLPPRLRAEGYFFAGCLWLEQSNGAAAGTAMQESFRCLPDEPRLGLIRIYLSRLLSKKKN